MLATVIGFLGSACGTVGGVGGGGIFVPMLTLIVGFDTKSAAALSKCKSLFQFQPLLPFHVFAARAPWEFTNEEAIFKIAIYFPSFIFLKLFLFEIILVEI